MLESILEYNGGVIEERLHLSYKFPGEDLVYKRFDSVEDLKSFLSTISDRSGFIIGEFGVRLKVDIRKMLEEVK